MKEIIKLSTIRLAAETLVTLVFIALVYHIISAHNNCRTHKQITKMIESNIGGNYFNVDSVKELIVKEGNLSAYNLWAYNVFIHVKRCDHMDLLPYSIYMANKYHYADIYYDVYRCLDSFQTFSEFDSLDSETKELAIMYLKKSSERRYGVAKLQLQRLKIE